MIDGGWGRFVCGSCFRDNVVAVYSWALGTRFFFSCVFFLLVNIGMHRQVLIAHWGLGFVGEWREVIQPAKC